MDKAEMILSVFQENEKKAFELLYDTYYEPLVLYANLFVENVEAAEDVVQDFFIGFWINKQFNALTTNLENYVYQSVRYKSLNHIREMQRRKKRHELVTRDTDDSHPDTKEEAALMDALYRALNALPEERRKVFLLICVDGLSYQQAADHLGISKNTVKTQMSRAIKYLRESLQENYLSSLLVFILKKIK